MTQLEMFCALLRLREIAHFRAPETMEYAEMVDDLADHMLGPNLSLKLYRDAKEVFGLV